MDTSWRRQLSRALSAVENRAPGWRDILADNAGKRADAFVVGVTGPPGAGKSTLIDAMAAHWASLGHRVAVLAIDPASPFSGGAVLGDRIRMQRSEQLDQVYIRSMSARGNEGGLNASAFDLCSVLAGSGASRIILETVGVGQNEIEVAFVVDCTLVVAVPGLGDVVQTAKAGLMEVGDIYVVNKGDLPGAAAVAGDIAAMLSLVFSGGPGRNAGMTDAEVPLPNAARTLLNRRFGDPADACGSWHPPVIRTSTNDEASIATLVDMIESCRAWLDEGGHLLSRRAGQVEAQLRNILKTRLYERLIRDISLSGKPFEAWVDTIVRNEVDAHAAADRLLGGPEGD
jgi:LAO/AO transport system kinase